MVLEYENTSKYWKTYFLSLVKQCIPVRELYKDIHISLLLKQSVEVHSNCNMNQNMGNLSCTSQTLGHQPALLYTQHCTVGTCGDSALAANAGCVAVMS
jgi:hypothetical protein